MKKSADGVFKDLAKKILHGKDAQAWDKAMRNEPKRGNWTGHKPRRRRKSDIG